MKHQGASDIEEGYVYGIASVVTPKHHLRKLIVLGEDPV